MNAVSFRRLPLLVAASFLALEASGQTLRVLPSEEPTAVNRLHLRPIGRLPASQCLDLAIGLPLRNQAELDELLRQLYNPTSPNFRKFLTPEQFTERFGPTENDYQAVIAFLQTNGLAVTGTHSDRMLLDVSGSVANIEKAFHLTMRLYQHPTEKRQFYAPDVNPSIPSNIPILGINGLNDYTLPRPLLHERKATSTNRPSSKATPAEGSGPAVNGINTYVGSDFRNAYVPGVTLNGAGQAVGLLEFDGYDASDITTYEQDYGLPNVPLMNVLLDKFSGTAGANSDEVSLDIEMAISMAPGLSKVVVYEAGPNGNPYDILDNMATNVLVRQISSSWTWGGGPDPSMEDQWFQKFAAQGQSYFQASGDSDAYVGSTSSDYPSDDAYLTSVGGTTLTMNGTGASYASETVWNWGYDSLAKAYVGSSGGISTSYAIPGWQAGINSFLTNGGSTTMRNVPDVALTADNVWVIYGGGQTGEYGGTSCAAPLWAGFMALVNQQAAAGGQTNGIGFINPAVYEIANESIYKSAFNDITTGSNTWPSSPNAFYAVPGYDLCTGLGTPAGAALINALVHPDPLIVVSNGGFNAVGSPAGTFNISSQTFYLTNISAAPLTWSLVNTSAWLNVSSGGGTLAAGAGGSLAVSLNNVASNLNVGTYTATIGFSNVTSGITHYRFFTLTVSDNLVQNGGFETGNFTGWTLSGSSSSFAVSSSPTYVHSGVYGLSAKSSSLGYITQNLPTVPGQTYLLSFWFYVTSTHSGQLFEANWNGATVYSTSSPPTSWSNQNFIVTATSTNTQIQFGLDSDSSYSRSFALDDISVTPVNMPVITQQPANQTVFAGGNATFTVAAGGLSPLAYQWRKNGNNIANGGNVSGATSNVLQFTAVTINNAGSYSVVITNAYGAVTSAVATLTVNLQNSTVALAASENPSGYKDSVNFMAAVNPASASGGVQFFANGVSFDSEPLVAAGATSVYLSSLPRGTNLITAIYSGDANDLPATNSLAQVVTNHPPTATPYFTNRFVGLPLKIPVTSLSSNWSDVDGDAVSLAAIGVSTNGVTVTNNAGTLFYSNSNNVDDEFTCTITDGWGGTNFQDVYLTIVPLPENVIPAISNLVVSGGNTISLSLAGASGFTYVLEMTTNLTLPDGWQPLATNTLGTNGMWQFTDVGATNFPERFYRLTLAPQ